MCGSYVLTLCDVAGYCWIFLDFAENSVRIRALGNPRAWFEVRVRVLQAKANFAIMRF